MNDVTKWTILDHPSPLMSVKNRRLSRKGVLPNPGNVTSFISALHQTWIKNKNLSHWSLSAAQRVEIVPKSVKLHCIHCCIFCIAFGCCALQTLAVYWTSNLETVRIRLQYINCFIWEIGEIYRQSSVKKPTRNYLVYLYSSVYSLDSNKEKNSFIQSAMGSQLIQYDCNILITHLCKKCYNKHLINFLRPLV